MVAMNRFEDRIHRARRNSDGVTEAMNIEQEFFEEERLVQTVSKHSVGTAEKILEGILADLDHFIGDAPQHDDITLIVAKVL